MRPEGCAKTSIGRDDTDAAVSEMVLIRLASRELARAMKARKRTPSADGEILAKLAAAEDRQRQLDAEWAAGELPTRRLKSMQAELDRNIEQLRTDLAGVRRSEPLERVAAGNGNIRAIWDDLSVERRRSIIDALVEKVEVGPTPKRGSNRFQPERLYPVWRA
jgi:hypothetical protein